MKSLFEKEEKETALNQLKFEKEEKETALNQLKVDLVSRYYPFSKEEVLKYYTF